jgi:hypothetical protein
LHLSSFFESFSTSVSFFFSTKYSSVEHCLNLCFSFFFPGGLSSAFYDGWPSSSSPFVFKTALDEGLAFTEVFYFLEAGFEAFM